MSTSDPGVVAVLAKAGADPNAPDDRGRSPLHLVGVFGKSPAIVAALVKAGADVGAVDEKGRTALQFAKTFSEQPTLVDALKKEVDKPSTSAKSTRDASCANWNTPGFFKSASPEAVSRCLESEDPNARNEAGRTPLHYAAQGGAPMIVTVLAQAGAHVNARDLRGGWTPLHLAAWFGKSRAVVEALLAAGADPEAKDEAGRIPWNYLGENPVLKDFDPPQPRGVACEDWNTALFFEHADGGDISRCLDAGTNTMARDSTGATPLHVAARNAKNPDIVTTLVSAGSRVGARDETGATPLHVAAIEAATPAILEALLNAGSDTAAKDETGRTARDYAKENPAIRDTDVFRRLAGVSCEDWNTALFFEHADSADVSRCIRDGATADVRDEVEATPLHLAASKSADPAVVELLLDAGGDPAARDKQGMVPWDYAKTNPALKGTEVYWRLNEGRFK